MSDFAKFVLLSALVVSSASAVFAQGATPTGVTEGTAAQQGDAAAPEAAGTRYAPGWSLSAGANAMFLLDSNPLLAAEPVHDTGQMYIGRLDLSRVGGRSTYLATYVPSVTRYNRFSELNSSTHSLEQQFRYKLSKADNFGWYLGARKYPAWTGNSFANSSMGALIMSLTGVNGLDLTSEVTQARTAFSLDHSFSRRSTLSFTVGGGAAHYSHSGRNPFAELFMVPASNTWTGDASVGYEYKLDKNRSVGVGASHEYFQYTSLSRHYQVDSLHLRYSQQFKNNWGFSVDIGPSFSGSLEPNVDVSGVVTHTGRHGTFGAHVQHRFSPGLLPGSLTTWSGQLSYDRAVSKRWIAGLYATYERSASVVPVPGNTGKAELYMAGAQVGYRLRRHITWVANYGYSMQYGLNLRDQRTSRQQVLTGLSFEFDSFLRR